MSTAAAIQLDHVTKIYRRYSGRQFATLKSAILQRSLMRELQPKEILHALTDVSFQVPKGSTFGVVGRNGSGKSTALKLVAGITKPTSGTVSVDGRISALIELGAGFHPEISGRENIFINGIMLGLTKREIEQRFDAIVDFAEMREFIEAPVKTYSSGMYMRLGFAVAIHVDPDVLLVDEVLAVGDEGFTHKCYDKFAEFKRRGKTILLVTHSLGLVERFCDEAVWLDHGRKTGQGDPKRVIDEYRVDVEKEEAAFLATSDAQALQAATPHVVQTDRPVDAGEAGANMFQVAEGRWGSGGVEISNVHIVDAKGQPSQLFHSGDPATIRFEVTAAKPVEDFVFGIGIFSAEGVCVYGTNTFIEKFAPKTLTGKATVGFSIAALELVEGTYKFDVAVHRKDGAPYDYHRLLYTFRVKSPVTDVGLYRPHHSWAFTGVEWDPSE
jgi:ABC-type polysaccharide/polyol phosphate transport system ATPase subunit